MSVEEVCHIVNILADCDIARPVLVMRLNLGLCE